MDTTTKIGQQAEKLAMKYLTEKNYKILATNWRHAHKEIDIIASKKDILVIVEVKFRKTSKHQEPYMAVSTQKQKNLVHAANAYIESHNINSETRFDIISITMQDNTYKLNHIEEAFSAFDL